MAVPSLVCRIAFDTAPLAAVPTWTDVSADVMSISPRSPRGKNHELNKEEAGAFTIKLLNTSGNYWPNNTGGAYYGKVLPKKKINLRLTWGGQTYDLFTGFIESWQPGFILKPDKLPIMTLACSDGLKYLAGLKINSTKTGTFTNATGTATGSPITLDSSPKDITITGAGNFTVVIPTGYTGVATSGTGATVTGSPQALSAGSNTVTVTGTGTISIQVNHWPQEKSGARIGHVLDYLGWPSADRDLDTGQSDVAGSGLFSNEDAISHMQAVQDAELGILFVSPDGKMTFHDRHHRLLTAACMEEDVAVEGAEVFNTLPAVTGPTAGSRVQLSAASITSQVVRVTALPTNSGYIYVGDSNVSATRYYDYLAPGEFCDIPVVDVDMVYIDAGSNGDGVIPAYAYAKGSQFGDSSDELPVASYDLILEDAYIKNDVRVTSEDGAEQVETDATSITAYGKVTLSKTGLILTTDTEAADQAAYLLIRYKDPVLRIKSVTIKPGADFALYSKVCSYDIGTPITIKIAQASISEDYYIESVEHSWDALHPQLFTTKWMLTSAYTESMWILGDAAMGILGSTTRVAY